MSTLEELVALISEAPKFAHYELQCSVTILRELREVTRAEGFSASSIHQTVTIVVLSTYESGRWRLLRDGAPYKEFVPNTITGEGGFLIDHTKMPKYELGVANVEGRISE